jgi:hypothetical protein
MRCSLMGMLLLIVCAYSTVVAREQLIEPHRIVLGLQPVFKKVLSGLDNTEITISPLGELVVEHQVREFSVHTVYRDGRIADKAHLERGPNVQGFRLLARVVPTARYEGPILLSPQGYGSGGHSPYWKTDVREVRLPTSNSHLWIVLDMGARVDQELLKKIDDAISEYISREKF